MGMIINPYRFGPTETLIDRTTGTNIGDMTIIGGLAAAFDGVTNNTNANSAAISGSPGFVGKTYGSGKVFSKAKIYGPNNGGFSTASNPSFTINIRGKNGTPSSRTDGTIIGTITFTDTADESAGREIVSTDTANSYTSIFADLNGGAVSTYCTELELWELI